MATAKSGLNSWAAFEEFDDNGWIWRFTDGYTKKHLTHIKIINNIKERHILAALSVNNTIISCGLGVLSDGLFGLFDIVTHPQHRNKGYGYKLISGMLHWALENGASLSYLQVVAENTPAIGLYKKFGYEVAHEYHYKIQNYK